MRLADFLSSNSELILSEWVEFAATCGPIGQVIELSALKDHALEMLKDIARDLREPQTAAQQEEKSKGNAPEEDGETAAEVHGSGRAESGFTLDEMVSEYRALRASVIRLWTKASGSLTGDDLTDLTRFNEAIDQAVAESVRRYAEDLDHSKEMFIAILGHDLRSPLGAVIMSSQFMLDTGELMEPHLTLVTRIASAGRRMNSLVGDLLDFTRSRLGSGVPIDRKPMDMGKAARDAIDEMAAAHPESVLRCQISGDLHGDWDCARVTQVMANLLANAVQHGSAKSPITVVVRPEGDGIELRVHNFGPPIPPSEQHGLFSPLKRLHRGEPAPLSNNLGLGLYIAERIVTAHAGVMNVESSIEAGTSFIVHLPKKATVAA
jgi:signal transduction histidine kinase